MEKTIRHFETISKIAPENCQTIAFGSHLKDLTLADGTTRLKIEGVAYLGDTKEEIDRQEEVAMSDLSGFLSIHGLKSQDTHWNIVISRFDLIVNFEKR